MRGTYIGNRRLLCSPTWGGKLVLPSEDLIATPEMLSINGLEGPLIKFMTENVKQGDTVVDVGANVGYFSVLLTFLIGPQGKLYAYEANPISYKYLADNLTINWVSDRAYIRNVAVYSEETTLSFFTFEHYHSIGSIHYRNRGNDTFYSDKTKEIKVKTITLDKDIPNTEKIDLVKMDIEGAEYHAFMGMQRLLTENVVKTVVFELNKNMLEEDWEPFMTLLTDLSNRGRQFFLLSGHGKPVPLLVTQLRDIPFYNHVVMQ